MKVLFTVYHKSISLITVIIYLSCLQFQFSVLSLELNVGLLAKIGLNYIDLRCLLDIKVLT